MIKLFTVLFLFLSLGEYCSHNWQLPIPGTVIGLIILLVLLVTLPGNKKHTVVRAEGFLRYLSLFYIPAGVGVVERLAVIEKDWLVLIAITVVATIIAQVIIAFVMKIALGKWASCREE